MLNNLQQIRLNLLQNTVIKKAGEITSDLIGNKIVDKITRVWKNSPKTNSETNEEEILKEKYISPELRRKIIDDLRIQEENFWYVKNNIIIW